MTILQNLAILADARHPDKRGADVAERKGIGHPDSLADAIADDFSRRYSHLCLARYGTVLNHWVDKVTLVGAQSRVELGRFSIETPIGCHLIGKITASVGREQLPIDELFYAACQSKFREATGDDSMFLHSVLQVHNTSSVAADHPENFYHPSQIRDGYLSLAANDTSACHANSDVGMCGKIAIDIENNAQAIHQSDLRVGSDFKVMVTRVGNRLTATVAIPVHADRVNSWREYQQVVNEVTDALAIRARKVLCDANPLWMLDSLVSNTKDTLKSGYIAPFGTSLGKGDCGAVGRGNRPLGVIEPMAPSSSEAPAGKNPIHHAGKVYTWLACELARRIENEYLAYAEVTIVSQNGAALYDDPLCIVSVDDSALAENPALIEKLWMDVLTHADDLPNSFLHI